MAEPRSYAFASWLFLRLLGLAYLAAFVSLAMQIRGLAGPAGILPASDVLAASNRRRTARFSRLPTLCWISTSDCFLLLLCCSGVVCAGLLTAAIAQLPMLILLWVFYLSLFNVCRFFLGFQWDVLLLETGFLAIFLAPKQLGLGFFSFCSPSLIIVWLFWWLLFRLMFSSGFVKLRSGDPSWRNFTALCYHYETQPLPTPVAWYAHQLPRWFHKMSTGLVLLIEVLAPFFIFGPTPFRYVVCGTFVGLMLLIELTGNYAFFNLLAVALSLLLLDDEFWKPIIRCLAPDGIGMSARSAGGVLVNPIIATVTLVSLFLSFDAMAKLFHRPLAWPKPLLAVLDFLTPFHLASSYGLFAVMTTERPEIIVEGSEDGVNWCAYEFKWKPGAVTRAPKFVAPFQPRLDWQLWFAALGYCENNPWFVRFLVRVLEGSKPVIHLLKQNPFFQRSPRYVRASMYSYRFTNFAERKANRAWWHAERRGTYCPIVEMSDSQLGRVRSKSD